MSTLVNYSSEEEEASDVLPHRHNDVNYDDVNMDMSEEENEDKEMQMFSSKEDYQAYKQQFSKDSKNRGKSSTASEHSSRREDQRSEDKRSPEPSSRRRHDEDKHSRRRQRRKSRSRSRDRSQRSNDGRHRSDKHRSRSRSRSRSKSRDRHRRHRDHRSSRGHRDQDSRSRKLQSLGLISGSKNEGPKTYESQLEKVKELTGVEVPKYYNPHAINPLKYAEQIKKRQMLWSKSSTESSSTSEVNPTVQSAPAPQPALASTSANPSSATSFNKWESTNFGNDKTNEKFRRLMGIKGGSGPASSSSSGPMAAEVPSPGSQIPPRTDKWFADQEQQYERARAITHTQRGLGLGFGSAVPPPVTEAAVSIEKKPMNFVKK